MRNINRIFLGGVSFVLISILGTTLYFFDEASGNQHESIVDKSIKRPFAEVPIEYEIYEIEASESSVIETKNGAVIEIPPNCFVNGKGESVAGKISLKYRDFEDMIDVFLSGISMEYDSVGEKYHLESAGMFELRGIQNDQPIFVKETSKVKVSYNSPYTGNYYNFYVLDEKSNNWEYLKKDKAGIDENDVRNEEFMASEFKALEASIEQLETKLPESPVQFDASKTNIVIDVLPEEFPELALFKNVKFELTDDEVDKGLEKIIWEKVKLQKKEGKYQLEFKKGRKSVFFFCRPVFEGEDLAKAQQEFERKNKKAIALLKEKKAQKKKLYDKLKSQKRIVKSSLARYTEENTAKIKMEETKNRVKRVFEVEQFGIYNSDAPHHLPQGELFALKLKYKGKKNKILLKHASVYLVEKKRNALYTYYSLDKFSYNPQSENLLWTVTENNKLAVFKNVDFNNFRKSEKEVQLFDMKVIDEIITSEEQVRKYLQL